uniref:Reverse transcriptase domain-containing protein n=1 Tax=Periophthalmus magnuspinnatus TaxID=409849 RepID=A0A3B4B1Z1_9GOBI
DWWWLEEPIAQIGTSGFKLNLNKCEILPLKPCAVSSACNNLIKSAVKYFGMQITKDKKDLEKLNIWDKLQTLNEEAKLLTDGKHKGVVIV